MIFLALLPLAACAPPGYQYDGFTLRSDAQEQAYNQAKIMRMNDQLNDQAAKSGYAAQWWANRPTVDDPDEYYEARDRLYNTELQTWIDNGGTPPEPPPVRP